jgi:probable addiction module antidote protein
VHRGVSGAIVWSFGTIARSKGMTEIAKELNLDRTGLYRSFSPGGNTSFITMLKVLNNLDFRLNIERNAS